MRGYGTPPQSFPRPAEAGAPLGAPDPDRSSALPRVHPLEARARHWRGCSHRSPPRRSQLALGRRNSGYSRVDRRGGVERPRKSLERRLDDMMRVVSPNQIEVYGEPGVEHDRAEELRGEEDIVVAQHLPLGNIDVVREIGT